MRYGLDLGGKKMDAVEFLRARRKLCDDNVCGESCPLFYCCDDDSEDNRIRQVLAVEKWAKEHPVKTRQSEFLKIFPSAQIEDETVSICPAKLNVAPHATNMGRTCIYVHDCAACRKCKRDFWLTEISEREADKMHRKQLRGAGIVGTLQGTKKPIKLGVIILLNAWKHL